MFRDVPRSRSNLGIQLNLSKRATLGTEESGRCKEVLNKSKCMDFCPPGRKKVAVAFSGGSTAFAPVLVI